MNETPLILKNITKPMKAHFKERAWGVKITGGPFGAGGTPDNLWCVDGLFVAIESKKNKGTLTHLQKLNLCQIRLAGGLPLCAMIQTTGRKTSIKLHTLSMEERHLPLVREIAMAISATVHAAEPDWIVATTHSAGSAAG